MAVKNPFKKQNIIDAAINVGIGGIANVAVDYAISNIDMLATQSDKTINIGKLVLGAVGSTMVSDKMIKAAMDGIAVVGVSNLAKSLMSETATPASNGEGTTGVPWGTIGRVRRMRPGLRRAGRAMMAGVPAAAQVIS